MNFSTIRNSSFFSAIALIALVAVTSPPAQAAEGFKLTVGYDYTGGRYGQNVTTEI